MIDVRTSSLPRARQAGFTLIEMVMAMVLTGILAGIVAQIIMGPVKGYFDSARRAELTDAADLALRRLSRELRHSVPNSLRISDSAGNVGSCVSGTCYIEYIATSGGGAYSTSPGFFGGTASCLLTPANCQLNVTSPMPSNPAMAVGDYIVLNNTNNNDLTSQYNAYACGSLVNCNISRVSSIAGSLTTLTAGGSGLSVFGFPAPSSSRFQVVPGNTKAVIYACAVAPGKGTLKRYWNYGLLGTPAAAAAAATSGGSSTTVASNASCRVSYPASAQTFGVLIVSLTLTDSSGIDSVTLMREIHVDNTP